MGVVRRYMNNLGKENWNAVEWIIRYLRGTTSLALCFGGSDTVLQGYVDAIWMVIKKVGGAPPGMCLLWVEQ